MPTISYKTSKLGKNISGSKMELYPIDVAGLAKCSDADNPYAVANEILCGQLGRSLCLPIPLGFLVEKEEKLYHVSLNFNLTNEPLSSADAEAIVQNHADLACGIVLFDIWIVNGDRRRQNLSYNKGEIRIFDHSQAFFLGHSGKQNLKKHSEDLGIANHCLSSLLVSPIGMKKWYERINALPDFLIEEALESAIQGGLPETERECCKNFLLDRRKKLLTLVYNKRKDAFPNISECLWEKFYFDAVEKSVSSI